MAKPKLDGVLGSVPIFAGLSKRQLRQVAAVSELADYMAGHSIVREGEIGDSFFIVLRGQAKVTVKGRTIHRAMPGDHFGEISLLDGGPRTATVTSETPMTLLSISRKSFLRAIEKDPQISFAMMGTMARMIRRVDRSLAG
ncbi:MAG: cyclic nucleotide-binding domain-containing protein [Actinomycetota bacterium]|nr:cyclic nucleotide-binding domain-containing protein [Actinomycetota bacterium]